MFAVRNFVGHSTHNQSKRRYSKYCIYAFMRTLPFGLQGEQSTQHVLCNKCSLAGSDWTGEYQGIGIKGKEMALVWHEKASRTALQTGTVTLHTLFWYRHTHMTFPPPGEYKYKQMLTEHRGYVLSRPGSGLIPDPGFHSVYSWILEPKYIYI